MLGLEGGEAATLVTEDLIFQKNNGAVKQHLHPSLQLYPRNSSY